MAEEISPTTSNSTTSTPEPDTRLTFGVELEYILATVAEGRPNPHPKDPRRIDGKMLNSLDAINYDILDKLQEVGIEAAVEEEEDGLPLSEGDLNNFWILKSDVSVIGTDPDDQSKPYVEYGMEMSSPPYYYDEASRREVQTVLRILRNNYLIRVNNTTGLHVHVGNGFFGLEWKLLRNLMAIAWTYERQIQLIFPVERLNTQYCKSFSESFLASRHPELSRLEFLNRILSFTSNEQIVKELDSQLFFNRLGFNLRGLETPYINLKRTIEFRQHHGTLDLEAILNWVHICVKLVEKACHIKDDDALFKQLRADVEKQIGFGNDHVSLIDYLMWLRCPVQAYYYGKKMIADKDQIELRICDQALQQAADHNLYRDPFGKDHVDVPDSGSGDDSKEVESDSNEDESS